METHQSRDESEAMQRRGAIANAQSTLWGLGISTEELLGKRTLHIGAGACDIGYLGKQIGADVMSLDNGMSDHEWAHTFKDEVPYVQADATKEWPFDDASFDLVVSEYAPPTVCTYSMQDIRQCLEEALRVLRPQGQFRFRPSILHGKFDNPFRMEREQKSAIVRNYSWSICQKIERKSHELLRAVMPSILIVQNEDEDYCVVEKE